MAKCIVKRAGHEEDFSERKLYKTVFGACAAAHMQRNVCSVVAGKVIKEVAAEIRKSKKVCVTSSQIFAITARILGKHDKDAAFMYKTHRDVS